jgi:hypothetical protein
MEKTSDICESKGEAITFPRALQIVDVPDCTLP